MITFNQHITLTENWGVISEAGELLIRRLIEAQDMASDEWKTLNPTYTVKYLPALPNTWEWVWLLERGEYRGKFAKRVAQYYFKTFGIKCPASFIERIGMIARENMQDTATYRFEFTKKITWDAGDFGDRGSCYWWYQGAPLELMMDNDAFAVCFYDADFKQGVGRAWMYEVETGVYVLWNGTGLQGYATLTAARVVASHLKLSYSSVELENNGFTGGMIYINSGRGYFIGKQDAIENWDSYDFEWDEPYTDTCFECGHGLDEDNRYWGADDNTYCERHFYDYFDYCAYCGDTFNNDELTITDYDRYCARCLDRLFVRCENCDEYVRKEDARTKDDTTYCENCYEDDETEIEDE